MLTRCKVVCSHIQKYEDGANLNFCPVYAGSEENKKFFKYTPGGTINLNVCNPGVVAQFEVGKEYYMDFIPAQPPKE